MTRTAKSILNSKVALLYSVCVFIVGFFSRNIFLEYLGAELLGLNTILVTLLQFLNLAELGIGTAIACTLYKPLFDNDQGKINEIVSLLGWMYRKIAYIIISAAIILMCFFPLIFQEYTFPLWYAYATFSILLVSALIGYFINYKQIILSANQQQYKIVYSYNSLRIFKLIFQILAISFFDNGYIWWLVIEFIFQLIASKSLNIAIKKAAPHLKTNIRLGKELRYKYPEIITKIKQVFAHKIGSIVLTQTQPLIISIFTSLALVSYYGNYMYIILGLSLVITSLFDGMSASVGNLIAEGDKARIMRVFDELYSSRFFIVSVLSLSAYYLTPQFIPLWVGSEYVMENSTLALMLTAFFIGGTRTTVDEYINAYGLFHDTWAPLIESILNIGLSVLLGYFFGLNGILIGSILSLVIVVLCWKPYFLFKRGVKESLYVYLKVFFKHIIILVAIVIVFRMFNLDFQFALVGNKYIDFIVNACVVFLCSCAIMFTCLYAVSRGLRDFTKRIRLLLVNKS